MSHQSDKEAEKVWSLGEGLSLRFSKGTVLETTPDDLTGCLPFLKALIESQNLVRVTERRWVRVRPWKSKEREDDGRTYTVEFQILSSINGGAANDLEVEGTIRWDGCANWGNPECAVHFCGPEEADELAACLRAAYALADDVMGGDSEYDRPEFTPFKGDLGGRELSPPEWKEAG